MYKILIVSFLLLSSLTSFTQNLQDAYANHDTASSVWSDDLLSYDGEYQIFLDNFFWEANNEWGNPLKDGIVTFSIEAVSFPFIPTGLDPEDNNDFSESKIRIFDTDYIAEDFEYGNLFSNNGASQVSYDGYGWQFGKYRIFQKLRNRIGNQCEGVDVGSDCECKGHYTLISYVFAGGIDTSYYLSCLLPHTILKHTLYFHCTDTPDTTIIDSISWIYDNTRGAMNTYPFYHPDSTKEELMMDPSTYDLTYRPTFPEGNYGYTPDSTNKDWYDSGVTNNTGSVDYFPPNEILVNYPYYCDYFDLYYAPDTPGYFMYINYQENNFYSNLVHPPAYILLDAPLLNYDGDGFAGYKQGTRMAGINHTYEINDPFDLSIINPSEKIIYNPSEVTIDCDLTFPCGYQFLTLHGKYPDKEHEVLHGDYSKEYWDGIPDFIFEYDRDYPVPVNCSTNSQPLSTYILDGITLTLQAPIIIMDAHFEGTNTTNKARIVYNPNKTYGNWTYDSTTVELDPVYYIIAGCDHSNEIDSVNNKSSFNDNNIKEECNCLKILNGLTEHPKIQVNLDRIQNAGIRVFDSMGSLKQTQTIVSNNQSVDCSSLKPGVYHAVLVNNGEVIDKISFGKK